MSKKKRLKSLTIFCSICIGIVIIYTVFEFIFSTITGLEHTTLTPCVYAFFGTELASTTIIKVFNTVKKEESDDSV